MIVSTLFFISISAQHYVAAHISNDQITVDMSITLATLDPRFVSLTYEIQNFIFNPDRFDWENQRLKNIVGAYSPQVMRCGGTWEDGMLWEAGPQTGICPTWKPPAPPRSAVNLTVKQWNDFASFVDAIPGLDVVVGLNSLLRDWGNCRVSSDQSCPGLIPVDLSNALAFIKYNRDKNYKIWGYELGNEPGVWNWTWGTPIVTPIQHARDFAALRKVINSLFSDTVETQPRVVGPDPTWGPVGDEQPSGGRGPPVWDYWNDTLQQNPDVDVAAFHYYSIQPSLVKNWQTFITIARDRSTCTAVSAFAQDLSSSPVSSKPLWLGEGGPSYGNVGRNWLILYGGSLNYLEDLGCAAANGASIFARYTLMNLVGTSKENYEPNPSYWVGYLWKQLTGNIVFSVSNIDEQIHTFALSPKDKTAKVTVAFINWHDDSDTIAKVLVKGFKCKHVKLYLLTPTSTEHKEPPVRATGIKLNGKQLLTSPNGSMPPLTPITQNCLADGSVSVLLPSLTAGFIVMF